VLLHVGADALDDAGVAVDQLLARLAGIARHARGHHDDVGAGHRFGLVGRDEAGVVEALPRTALRQIERATLGGSGLDVDQDEVTELLHRGPVGDGCTDVAAGANDCDLRALDHGARVIP